MVNLVFSFLSLFDKVQFYIYIGKYGARIVSRAALTVNCEQTMVQREELNQTKFSNSILYGI